MKYITSIGDYDWWWRLQQHRSVSNEWMRKPGHLQNIEKSEIRPGSHCCPQLKIIHSQLIEKDMTQKDFHWKTMMKIMKMVILQKGQSMMKRIQGLFILVIGWLALSAMEPFVCSILHNFLPASNNWINGQHGFIIKNETKKGW